MRIVTAALVLSFLLINAPAASAGCGPAGTCAGGFFYNCELFYNYLENWDFEQSCDWNYSGASRATDGEMCQGTFQSAGYGHLYRRSSPRTSRIYQTVYIPLPGEPGYFSSGTNWTVAYNIEFEDLYLESGNTVRVRVYDNDTNTLIASGPLYRGSLGDPDCRRDDFTFTADLNGKNVRLEVYAVWSLSDYGEAWVNIDNVALTQRR